MTTKRPKNPANRKPLGPIQREAMRMEAQGASVQAIAKKLEVNLMTVYRWRKHPDYEAGINALLGEMDVDTVRDVRKLRGEALRAVRIALTRSLQGLGKAEPLEAVRVGEFALKVYATTSAQTGRKIVSGVEVSGPGGGPITIDPASLASLTDEQLAAAETVFAAIVEQPLALIDAEEGDEDGEE